MKCLNTQALEAFIVATYPTVTPIQHTIEQRQFTFPCGLIMNIYTTGTETVHFPLWPDHEYLHYGYRQLPREQRQ